REISAHSVHTSTGWCRCGAEINTVNRGRIRTKARDRSREQLRDILRAAVDVAADEIGIMPLKIGGKPYLSRQDALAKTGRETLDLILDPLRHVDFAAVGNMTISPRGMLTGRGARCIEQARLHDEDERLFAHLAAPRCSFRYGDLVHRSANVHGRSE